MLTSEQSAAFKDLCGRFQSDKAETSLLFGVTGSGKTKVYMRLIDEVLKTGKGCIVMVPEISLTPQLLSLFTTVTVKKWRFSIVPFQWEKDLTSGNA